MLPSKKKKLLNFIDTPVSTKTTSKASPSNYRNDDSFDFNLETIRTVRGLNETQFVDYEQSDSENSEDFDFDKECTTGLVEDIDSLQESQSYTDNGSNDGDDDLDQNEVGVQKFFMRDELILILPRCSTVYFDGLMSVTVLHGEVDVLGYTLNKLTGTKELFSPRGCSRLYIKNMGNRCHRLAENIFSDIHAPKDLLEAVRKLGPSDSILLCKDIKSFQVDFLVNHMSQQIYPTTENMRYSFSTDQQDGNSIRVNPKWDEIVDGMDKSSRVLLAGGKSVGKSTMLRYMVNKLLMDYKEVLVIDLDPGQPEFTVPGCISASIVKQPLFGPNFTHLRKPVRCIFVPDIELSEDANEYLSFVEFLMKKCEDISPMPTVINHMGFTRGLGLYILSAVIVCTQPGIVVDIRSVKKVRNYSESLTANAFCENANMFKMKAINAFTRPKVITISSMSDDITRWNLEPRLIREMCVLNYFGTMITRMGMAITATEACSYKINTSSVKLIDKDGPIPLSTVNASLVALCASIYNSNCYNCIGWGIVRSINVVHRYLYVLTPVSQCDLENVDTLILGSVTLPPSLLMNTSKVKGLIPYVANQILNKHGGLTKRSHIPRGTKRGLVAG